jgi:hypothetical protein
VALISRIAVADMTDISKAPIILHAADALRRARKLPVGAARNDSNACWLPFSASDLDDLTSAAPLRRFPDAPFISISIISALP